MEKMPEAEKSLKEALKLAGEDPELESVLREVMMINRYGKQGQENVPAKEIIKSDIELKSIDPILINSHQ